MGVSEGGGGGAVLQGVGVHPPLALAAGRRSHTLPGDPQKGGLAHTDGEAILPSIHLFPPGAGKDDLAPGQEMGAFQAAEFHLRCGQRAAQAYPDGPEQKRNHEQIDHQEAFLLGGAEVLAFHQEKPLYPFPKFLHSTLTFSSTGTDRTKPPTPLSSSRDARSPGVQPSAGM